MDDQEALPRVTLLEGVPFEKELAGLPFQTKKFPAVFRDTKINTGPVDLLSDFRPRMESRTASGLNATSGVFTPRTSTPASVYSPYGGIANLDGASLHTQVSPNATPPSDA